MLQTLGLLLGCQLAGEFVATRIEPADSRTCLGLGDFAGGFGLKVQLGWRSAPDLSRHPGPFIVDVRTGRRRGYWQFRRSLFGLGQVAGGTDPFHDFVDACNRGHIYHHETTHL